MTAVRRNDLDRIQYAMAHFPAVALIGARQVGKTALAKTLYPDWDYLDLENPEHFERLMLDPGFYLKEHSDHLIIDEAQEYPEIFRILRGVIDDDRERKGRFLLTGSSSLELLTHISESLAGRIAIIEIGTLKVNEIEQKSLNPFYEGFKAPLSRRSFDPLILSPYVKADAFKNNWFYGGYPEPVLQQDPKLWSAWMDNYRMTYLNRDIAKLFPKLNRVAYRRFLNILAYLSGTIINKAEIARNIEVSEKTIHDYLNIVEGTFLWRQLPSFETNRIKSTVKMPKGYYRDTGLLHFLLSINDLNQLQNSPYLGQSFEAYVIESLLKGINSAGIVNWHAYHYRTRGGAEIDLILEGPFGLLPVEVKYGRLIKKRQLMALNDFVQRHDLPLGLVINQSDEISWLSERILQIPIVCV